MAILLGSDALLASGRLDGCRVGIVCNPASIDASFRHIVDRLAARPGVTLGAIFGPQHGFQADVQDNMIENRPRPRSTAGRAGLLPLQRNAGADR